jgi:adenylate cyclase
VTEQLEEAFAREIMRSERTRMAILAALLAGLAAGFAAMFFLFHRQYLEVFRTREPLEAIVGVMALLVAYELGARHFIGRRLERGAGLPGSLRFWTALAETAMPTLLIVLISREVDPVYVLQSAASYLYAIFIVLSTLRLDFRLSAFTGASAALQYAALAAWYMHDSATAAGTPFATPPFYVAKAALLFGAGLAAGFVASEVRRRVRRILRIAAERERMLAAFGQQVSPEIAAALLRQGGRLESRRRFVCVMFMDIRGFTRLVQDRSPEEVVAWQNAAFGAAVDIVGRHQGVINQFLGDGFMATFGAPVPTGRESANALAASRELLRAVQALIDAGRLPAMTIGIGLHAGEAVTGNIGSEARQQYSVTGEVVILASRIEQLNKVYASQLLASAEVLQDAGETPPPGAALGPVKVRGRDAPVEIYRLA